MIKDEKLLLGGQERAIRFGLMGFFKHVGAAYSGDPLDLVKGSSEPKKQYEMTLAIIYAGLKCAGATETVEQVDAMVQELPLDDAVEIMRKYRDSYAQQNGKPGETEARELVSQ